VVGQTISACWRWAPEGEKGGKDRVRPVKRGPGCQNLQVATGAPTESSIPTQPGDMPLRTMFHHKGMPLTDRQQWSLSERNTATHGKVLPADRGLEVRVTELKRNRADDQGRGKDLASSKGGELRGKVSPRPYPEGGRPEQLTKLSRFTRGEKKKGRAKTFGGGSARRYHTGETGGKGKAMSEGAYERKKIRSNHKNRHLDEA